MVVVARMGMELSWKLSRDGEGEGEGLGLAHHAVEDLHRQLALRRLGEGDRPWGPT